MISRSSPLATRRRSRQVGLIVVGLVIVGVLIGEIANDVVNSSQPANRRAAATWAAGTEALASDSSGLVGTLDSVRNLSTASAISAFCAKSERNCRLRYDVLLDSFLNGAKSDLSSYEALNLGAPNARVGAAFSAVLEGRVNGASELVSALQAACNAAPGAPPASAMAAVLGAAKSIVHSDASYRAFARELKKAVRGTHPPAAGWTTSPSMWSSSSLSSWMHALSAAPQLASRTALRLVAISISPPPISISGLPTTTTIPTSTSTTTTSTTTTIPGFTSTSSTSTTTTTTTIPPTTTTLQIPPTQSVSSVVSTTTLHVSIVVGDVGSTQVHGVVVQAQISPVGSSTRTKITPLTRDIGSIGPGDSRYLRFGTLTVRPGTTNLLVVTATSVSGVRASETLKICVLN